MQMQQQRPIKIPADFFERRLPFSIAEPSGNCNPTPRRYKDGNKMKSITLSKFPPKKPQVKKPLPKGFLSKPVRSDKREGKNVEAQVAPRVSAFRAWVDKLHGIFH